MWAAIGTIAAIVLLLTKFWLDSNDRKRKEKTDAKKEIKDSVDSGNLSRINAVINKLRR